jgi:hypothetical protein
MRGLGRTLDTRREASSVRLDSVQVLYKPTVKLKSKVKVVDCSKLTVILTDKMRVTVNISFFC